MGQSNVIFGAILIAFIVYITAKGELATYIQLLFGGGAQPAGGNGTGDNSSVPSLDTLLQGGKDITFFNNGTVQQGSSILGSGQQLENLLNH